MAKKKTLPAGFTARENGTYQYRFSIDGKRYAVYGATVKECKAKELEKREQLAAGIISAKSMTVEKWMTTWSNGRAGRLSGSAIRTNNQHLRRACRQQIGGGRVFGQIKLEKLEAVHVRELQSVLAGQFTTRTTNDTIAYLKQGLNAAVNERVLVWNPCNAVESLKRTEEPARDTIHRCLSKEEVKAFLELAKAEDSNYYNLYVFLLNTGLRLGEAGAVTPGDIRNNNVHITKTVTREESGYIIREQTKTEAGRRIVPLNDQARAAIRAEQDAKVVQIGKPVFTTSGGGLLISSLISEDIERICNGKAAKKAKIQIERFTAHAFRATFISRCVAAGMPIKDLMEIVGHRDVQMTLALYAHSNTESRAESLSKVAVM